MSVSCLCWCFVSCESTNTLFRYSESPPQIFLLFCQFKKSCWCSGQQIVPVPLTRLSPLLLELLDLRHGRLCSCLKNSEKVVTTKIFTKNESAWTTRNFTSNSSISMIDLHWLLTVNPFTPESDQCQISPQAPPEILHHTVRRTWLIIAYSDERWL